MSDSTPADKLPNIPFDDFVKVNLRVGRVLESRDVLESQKLIRLVVDFNNDQRVIFTGLRPKHESDWFVGKKFIFVYNLEPKKMMSEESHGMLLSASSAEGPVPIEAPEDCREGDSIK